MSKANLRRKRRIQAKLNNAPPGRQAQTTGSFRQAGTTMFKRLGFVAMAGVMFVSSVVGAVKEAAAQTVKPGKQTREKAEDLMRQQEEYAAQLRQQMEERQKYWRSLKVEDPAAVQKKPITPDPANAAKNKFIHKDTTRYIPEYDATASFRLSESSTADNYSMTVSGKNAGTGPSVTFEGSFQVNTFVAKGGKPVKRVKLWLHYKDGASQAYNIDIVPGKPQGENIEASTNGPNNFRMDTKEMENAGLTDVMISIGAVAAARAEERLRDKKSPQAQPFQTQGPLPEP